MGYFQPSKQEYLLTKIVLNIGFIPLLFFVINKTQINDTPLGFYVGTENVQLVATFIALLFIISLFSISIKFTKTNNKARELGAKVFHKSFDIGVWGTIALIVILTVNIIADFVMSMISNSNPSEIRNGIIFILLFAIIFVVNKYGSNGEVNKNEE